MRLMATIAALAFLGWNTTAHAQTLEIAPTGIVGNNGNGTFKFELKNPGAKKLAVLNPIAKVTYKGVEVPNTGYSSNTQGGLKGDITISNQVIPVGKALVKLKVNLDDGTTKEVEAEVDFQKILQMQTDEG